MATATSLELDKFVNDTADEFERSFDTKVSSGSRHELIKAAEPHIDAIQSDLDAGNVTSKFLKEVLFEVLENARQMATDRGGLNIGEDTTIESMERKCRYLGWC